MHFALKDDADRIAGYTGPGGQAALVFSSRELADAAKYGSLQVVELTTANVNEFVARCKAYRLTGVLIDADDFPQASRARRATFTELIRAAHVRMSGKPETA